MATAAGSTQAQQPARKLVHGPEHGCAQPNPLRTHCTCAFEDVPGEYPCAVHGEQPAPAKLEAVARIQRSNLRDGYVCTYGDPSWFPDSFEVCRLSSALAWQAEAERLRERYDEMRTVAQAANGAVTVANADANAAEQRAEQAEGERKSEQLRNIELRDCGQDGVCAIAPGCVRHWTERNIELSRRLDKALADQASAEELRRKESGRANEAANRCTRLELRAENAVRGKEQAERERDEMVEKAGQAMAARDDWESQFNRVERERDEARSELAAYRPAPNYETVAAELVAAKAELVGLKAWKLDCERNCLARDREERIPLKIAERAAGEVCGNHPDNKYDGECGVCSIGAEAIERAIREAAAPLVEALEMAEHLLDDDPAIHDVIVAALKAWKEEVQR